MTSGIPDGLALPLGGGQVLLGPAGALLVANALAAAEIAARRDGIRAPASLTVLRAALDQAAAEARDMAETAKVARRARLAASLAAPPPWVDPIGAAEAAQILGVSPQYARSLCRREAFTSARRRSGAWVVERAEVLARVTGITRASTGQANRERDSA